MVKGRPGLYLEAFKFTLYVTFPIYVSYLAADPEFQKANINYYNFIEPPKPPIRLSREETKIEHEKILKQRAVYQDQVRKLMQQAQIAEEREKLKIEQQQQQQFASYTNESIDDDDTDDDNDDVPKRSGWLRFFRFGRGSKKSEDE
jgi:hypothetical protein